MTESEDNKETRFHRSIHYQETDSRLRLPLDLQKIKPQGGIELAHFLEGIRHITNEQFLSAFPHPFLVQSKRAEFRDPDDTFFDTVYGELEELPIADKQACLVFPLVKRPVNSFTGMITVGRTPNNDLVLPHPLVSKFHAYFRVENNMWKLRDSNSRNRTYVTEKSIEPNEDYTIVDKTLISFSRDVSFLFFEAETFWSAFLK